jgi:hypothetical protein
MIEWWFLALMLPMAHPGKYEYFIPPPVVIREYPSKASCEAGFKSDLPPLLVKQGLLVCIMGPVGGHSIDQCKLDPPLLPNFCKDRTTTR